MISVEPSQSVTVTNTSLGDSSVVNPSPRLSTSPPTPTRDFPSIAVSSLDQDFDPAATEQDGKAIEMGEKKKIVTLLKKKLCPTLSVVIFFMITFWFLM